MVEFLEFDWLLNKMFAANVSESAKTMHVALKSIISKYNLCIFYIFELWPCGK